MSKQNVLIWAGWYPNRFQNQAIFIQKHIQIIGKTHHVKVFHISHKHQSPKWFSVDKYFEGEVENTQYYIPSFFLIKHALYFLIPIIEAWKMKKIDVFHLHVSYPFVFFTIFLDFFKINKYVISDHWSGFTKTSGKFDRMNFFQKWFFKKRLFRFQKISLVSEFLKNEFYERTQHNGLTVIPNVIELNPNHLKVDYTFQTFKLLSVSNLVDEVKNISLLIRVFNKLLLKFPNITLDIFGEGPDFEILEKKAKDLGLLNKTLFFKGYIENQKLQTLYQTYNAFVLMSNFETFSIVTFEAIYNGLPVVVTKCGGVEEFVNSDNGILVSLNDEEIAVKSLSDLIENYQSYSKKNYRKTLQIENFTEEKISNLFLELYQ